MDTNQIYIEKRNRILVPDTTDSGEDNTILVATIAKNLESLGYTFSQKLFDKLCKFPQIDLEVFYQEIVPILKKQTGAHKQFRPMYPNFPRQVMEASEVELFFNAIVHYWSFGQLMPEYEKLERLPLAEKTVKLKVLDLGSYEDFESIFTNLLRSNSSISEGDKEIVKWFVRLYKRKIVDLIPDKIPQKEQLALLTNELRANNVGIDGVKKYVKTATDVLRIATAMSDGDVSLAGKCVYKKFNRADRRFLLELLEDAGNIIEDLLRHDTKWIKLGEILHPGEYKTQFPKVYVAFDNLRNERKIRTFNSKVEKSLKNHNTYDTISLLTERPGDFARRLDHVLRACGTGFVPHFIEVADRVSTPVLLQVFNHFKNRETFEGPRAIFPKGQLAKVQVLDHVSESLGEEVCHEIVAGVRDVLVERFSRLSPLGATYIDPKLKNYIVPFSQRSASKSLRTIARGSKVDLPETNILRFFLWWKDGDSRTDIDLSALMYSSDWKPVQDITYYNLRGLNCYHSGDITSAPNGAAEFIDIDRDKLLSKNARYVLMILNSYTQQPYCDLPECFAGWMGRSAPNSGEVFEPRTVMDRIDVTSDTTICIPIIFDLVAGQAIWVDVALKSHGWLNNVASNKGNIQKLGSALCNLNKPNLYDLFELHTIGRGNLVSKKEEANQVFGEYQGLTPRDIDKILSEYLQ
jgi:hypothetical protein